MSGFLKLFQRLRIVILAAVPVVAAVSPAIARQSDADFNKYCRTTFANSAYQAFAQSWGTEHSCVQGGTRQGIDLDRACELTTGFPGFEILGSRVLCAGEPVDAAQEAAGDLGEPDYAGFCRKFFANSAYERHPESPGTIHKCRQPGATGGFTLQNVDPYMACNLSFGTRTFRLVDGRIICIDDTAHAGAGGSQTQGGGAAPGPGLPFPMPPDLPFPMPQPMDPDAPGIPLPTFGADKASEAAACAALGGAWRANTLPVVEDLLANMQDTIAERTAICANMTDFPQCEEQMETAVLVQKYMRTIMIWQCHFRYIQDQHEKPREDVITAAEEGCSIQSNLDQLAQRIDAVAGTMANPPHTTMMSGPELIDPCALCLKYEPGSEVPDLVALARDQRADSDTLFEDLDLPAEMCPDQGALTRPGTTQFARISPLDILSDFLVRPARAQSPDSQVTSDKGPFPGRKFGQTRSSKLVFDGVRRIRELQDEMSNHDGRDDLLNQHSWSKFERDVAFVLEGMKIRDNPAATIMVDEGIRTLLNTQSALNRRLTELDRLQAQVQRELDSDGYRAFLKSLGDLIEKNRQLEDPGGNRNAHDPTFTQLSLLARNLMAVGKEIPKGAPVPLGPVVGAILGFTSTYASAVQCLNWWEDEADFERLKEPYLELLDLTSSLLILRAQYEARVEAQDQMIERVFEEWEKEQARRRECRRQ